MNCGSPLGHDLDQHPRAVRPLLMVERKLGLISTWYFRSRTPTHTCLRPCQGRSKTDPSAPVEN